MKVRLLLFALFSMLSLSAWMPVSAQQVNDSPFNSPSFGMSLGSSFSSGFNGGGMFSQSIAPHLQWSPGQRWELVVGTIFSSSQMNGINSFSPLLNSQAGAQAMPQRMFSNTVYASGAYQVNNKLTLTGSTWLEHNNMPQGFEAQMNPMAFGGNGKGMMIGLDYRLNENLRFGAEVRMSSGFNPYSPSFFNPGRNSVFQPGRW